MASMYVYVLLNLQNKCHLLDVLAQSMIIIRRLSI